MKSVLWRLICIFGVVPCLSSSLLADDETPNPGRGRHEYQYATDGQSLPSPPAGEIGAVLFCALDYLGCKCVIDGEPYYGLQPAFKDAIEGLRTYGYRISYLAPEESMGSIMYDTWSLYNYVIEYLNLLLTAQRQGINISMTIGHGSPGGWRQIAYSPGRNSASGREVIKRVYGMLKDKWWSENKNRFPGIHFSDVFEIDTEGGLWNGCMNEEETWSKGAGIFFRPNKLRRYLVSTSPIFEISMACFAANPSAKSTTSRYLLGNTGSCMSFDRSVEKVFAMMFNSGNSRTAFGALYDVYKERSASTWILNGTVPAMNKFIKVGQDGEDVDVTIHPTRFQYDSKWGQGRKFNLAITPAPNMDFNHGLDGTGPPYNFMKEKDTRSLIFRNGQGSFDPGRCYWDEWSDGDCEQDSYSRNFFSINFDSSVDPESCEVTQLDSKNGDSGTDPAFILNYTTQAEYYNEDAGELPFRENAKYNTESEYYQYLENECDRYFSNMEDGGSRYPLRPKRIQVYFIVPQMLHIFKTLSSTQRIIRYIQHMVRFMVRKMNLQQF